LYGVFRRSARSSPCSYSAGRAGPPTRCPSCGVRPRPALVLAEGCAFPVAPYRGVEATRAGKTTAGRSAERRR